MQGRAIPDSTLKASFFQLIGTLKALFFQLTPSLMLLVDSMLKVLFFQLTPSLVAAEGVVLSVDSMLKVLFFQLTRGPVAWGKGRSNNAGRSDSKESRTEGSGATPGTKAGSRDLRAAEQDTR